MRPIPVDRWLDLAGRWLLPPRCVLCRGTGQPPALDLCADCEADFVAIANPCVRCGLPCGTAPAGDGLEGCVHCRTQPLPYRGCFAPYVYDFPLDHLIQALKYGGALANARVLGAML